MGAGGVSWASLAWCEGQHQHLSALSASFPPLSHFSFPLCLLLFFSSPFLFLSLLIHYRNLYIFFLFFSLSISFFLYLISLPFMLVFLPSPSPPIFIIIVLLLYVSCPLHLSFVLLFTLSSSFFVSPCVYYLLR